VTPGLFAGFSQLGLAEVDGVAQANQTEADKSPFGASLDMSAGVNPSDTRVADTRIDGVTRAATSGNPGEKIFGGQGALITTAETADPVVRPRAFQYVIYGETGSRIAGGSRPAVWAALTNALAEAERYSRNPAAYERDQSTDQIVPRQDAAALAEVVAGRQPLLVRVDQAKDIRQILTLKRSYPRLRLVLVSANEGWRVARDIAAANVPVITLGMDNLPNRFESIGSTLSNVGRLVAAGVTVALGTPDLDASFQPRLINTYAGNMVAQGRLSGETGLSWSQALATITSAPARIFGLERELGTLEPGKRADVVIWDGDPLELTSAPVAVFIDGVPQSMTTRQTLLRDRYLGIGRTDLPVAYPRASR
jgi:imidazolonepropionase-like amidohydrolase